MFYLFLFDDSFQWFVYEYSEMAKKNSRNCQAIGVRKLGCFAWCSLVLMEIQFCLESSLLSWSLGFSSSLSFPLVSPYFSNAPGHPRFADYVSTPSWVKTPPRHLLWCKLEYVQRIVHFSIQKSVTVFKKAVHWFCQIHIEIWYCYILVHFNEKVLRYTTFLTLSSLFLLLQFVLFPFCNLNFFIKQFQNIFSL